MLQTDFLRKRLCFCVLDIISVALNCSPNSKAIKATCLTKQLVAESLLEGHRSALAAELNQQTC